MAILAILAPLHIVQAEHATSYSTQTQTRRSHTYLSELLLVSPVSNGLLRFTRLTHRCQLVDAGVIAFHRMRANRG